METFIRACKALLPAVGGAAVVLCLDNLWDMAPYAFDFVWLAVLMSVVVVARRALLRTDDRT